MHINSGEILRLLEKPTKNRWAFVSSIRDEAATSDIVAALRTSTRPSTRKLLCYILAQRPEAGFTDTIQAIPVLVEMLQDQNLEVRYQAAEALERISDPKAGPALLEQYHKEKNNPQLQGTLASALGISHYEPAIPILIEALSSSDEGVRQGGARGLMFLKTPKAQEALQQALTTVVDSPTIEIINEILQELTKPVATQKETITTLLKQLKDSESTEREAAARILADMLDARVVRPLLKLLRNKQAGVRQYATLTLAWMAENRASRRFVREHRGLVQGPLIQALQDQESSVRAVAAQALGNWGNVRAVQPLLERLQDADTEVRRQVTEALAYLKDERALEPLLHIFLTDEDLDVRKFAAQGLGQWEDNRAVNILIQSLQDEQADVRKNAVEMLCWLKDERAVDALILALQDKDSEVREWVIEALWSLCVSKGDNLSSEASEKIRQPLLLALQDENNEVKEGAAKILKWLE